jgi:hypothetical protein
LSTDSAQIEHLFGLEVEPDFFQVGEWRDTASQIVTVTGTMFKLRTRLVDFKFPGDVCAVVTTFFHRDEYFLLL